MAFGSARTDTRLRSASSGGHSFDRNEAPTNTVRREQCAIAKRLPAWVIISIKRKVPVPLVASITRCIYQRRQMIAEYFSLTSGSRGRLLSPVALINDGLRWHVRCFYHEENEFRDYNLARFIEVQERDLSDVSEVPGWSFEP